MGYFKEYVNQNKYQDKKSNPITTISSLKQVKTPAEESKRTEIFNSHRVKPAEKFVKPR